MSDIHIRRTHHLDETAARGAAERVAADLQRKHSFDYRWQGTQLVFERSDVSGALTFEGEVLELRMALSPLLLLFRGQLEAEIHRFLDEEFGEA